MGFKIEIRPLLSTRRPTTLRGGAGCGASGAEPSTTSKVVLARRWNRVSGGTSPIGLVMALGVVARAFQLSF